MFYKFHDTMVTTYGALPLNMQINFLIRSLQWLVSLTDKNLLQYTTEFLITF